MKISVKALRNEGFECRFIQPIDGDITDVEIIPINADHELFQSLMELIRDRVHLPTHLIERHVDRLMRQIQAAQIWTEIEELQGDTD